MITHWLGLKARRKFYRVVFINRTCIILLQILLWISQFTYRKNSKNWDTLNYHRDCPTNGIVAFYSAILGSKDSDRIANRVDTDQTAP